MSRPKFLVTNPPKYIYCMDCGRFPLGSDEYVWCCNSRECSSVEHHGEGYVIRDVCDACVVAHRTMHDLQGTTPIITRSSWGNMDIARGYEVDEKALQLTR